MDVTASVRDSHLVASLYWQEDRTYRLVHETTHPLAGEDLGAGQPTATFQNLLTSGSEMFFRSCWAAARARLRAVISAVTEVVTAVLGED